MIASNILYNLGVADWESEFANNNFSELIKFLDVNLVKISPYLIKTLDSYEMHPSFTFNDSFFEEALGEVERSGFWAMYRAALIKNIMEKNRQVEIWDIGAGNGNVAIPLVECGLRVVAVEPTDSGAGYLACKKILTIGSSLEQLHFLQNVIEVGGVFDVLGHVNDPSLFLAQLKILMKPGGYIFCLVPAHKFLYSDYDLAIKQQRRFSKKDIQKLFEENEFEIIQARFVFSVLAPISFFLRRIPYFFGVRRTQEEFHSKLNRQVNHNYTVTNILVYCVKLIDKLNLPFGLSILVVARQP
jgi:SAM-dependent methyltransferase